MNKIFRKIIQYYKIRRMKNIDKMISKNKWKSPFLKSIIIKQSYSPPFKEKIIKGLSLFALIIGIKGITWRSRLRNKSIVNEAYNKIIDHSFIYLPSAFAFSLIMAFIPILLLIYIIVASNPSLSLHVNKTLELIFGKYAKIFSNAGTSWGGFVSSSAGLISVLFIILLSTWTAAAGFSKFIFSCSMIYKHDRYGGFWMNRFRGIAIVILTSLFLSVVLLLFTGIVVLINKNTWLSNISWLHILVNKIILFIITIFSIYIGIGMLFKFAPRFKLKWKHIHPGAIIATIPTSLFLTLFTNITSYAFNYTIIGGSLSYFMTMSMSLLVFSYFLYIGVIVNAAFYSIHVRKTTWRKRTISRK